MLGKLPRWFRHILGFATLLVAVQIGHSLGVVAAPTVFGILAWIYIAKGGESNKKEGPTQEDTHSRGPWYFEFFSSRIRPTIWIPAGLFFLVLLTLGELRNPPQTPNGIKPSPDSSSTSYRTKIGFFGCATMGDLARATDFWTKKDYTAFDKLIASGSCIQLKPAMDVFIEDVVPGKSLVKIRVRGDLGSVWTSNEIIEPVGDPFSIGDRLVNRHNGSEMGIILDLKSDHTFPNGTVGRAYLVKLPHGTEIWMVANRVEQIAIRR